MTNAASPTRERQITLNAAGPARAPAHPIAATLAPRPFVSFLLASLLIFFPSAFRYLTGSSSNAPGLVIACGALILLAMATHFNSERPYARQMAYFWIGAAVFIVMHLFAAVFIPIVIQDIDLSRTVVSLLALVLCGVAGGVVVHWLAASSPSALDRLSGWLMIVLPAISILCLVGIQPPSPLAVNRPSFPFTEPSHFALVAAPFIINAIVRASVAQRYAWLAFWLTLAFFNQSTSLIVVLVLAAFVSLSLPYAFIAAAVVIAVALQLDLQYYLDRLDFTPDSGNLSALIYRQGWELLAAGLQYSKGWGIGFQQLGSAPLNVPTSDLIYRLLNDDSNLRDGGFLAAKLVSELGVFGLAITGFCLAGGMRGVIILRRIAALPRAQQNSRERLAAAVLVAFQVEMFMRGIGYFSSTAVLFVAAVLYLGVWPRADRQVPRGGAANA